MFIYLLETLLHWATNSLIRKNFGQIEQGSLLNSTHNVETWHTLLLVWRKRFKFNCVLSVKLNNDYYYTTLQNLLGQKVMKSWIKRKSLFAMSITWFYRCSKKKRLFCNCLFCVDFKIDTTGFRLLLNQVT